MRQALRQLNRGRKSQSLVLPAPSRGWNAKESVDSMHPLDAVALINWFPTASGVKKRSGSAQHATGLGDWVYTLAEFDAGATKKMIAGANGNIWDVTSAGAASSLASGFSNNKWQWAQFDPAGTAKMGLVNGSDAPQEYDGSTVSAMTVSGSGLTPSNLDGINVFKGRSYFWDSSTQDFWYSATNALGGTLTKFPLGRVSGFGGNLTAMGTWNVDGGDGVNDMAVFCMSSGDVIVYNGDDPGSNWSLVGVFRLGAPLSTRSIAKVGNDLVITTTDGYVPLSKVLASARAGGGAVSDNIRNEVLNVTSTYKANYGWDIVHYPKGNMLVFNVPVSSLTYHQHVMNTLTGAWAKFTGWDGVSWSVFNDELYFGGNGIVYKADTGTADDGTAIHCIGQQAWNHLGLRGAQKSMKLARIVGRTNTQDLTYKLEVGVDFVDASGVADDTSPALAGSLWDTSDWDTSSWPDETRVIERWETTPALGEVFSPRVQVLSSTVDFDWYSIGLTYEVGGLI